MDGRRIDQHRIIVDRELGRTKTTWYPRRLGGGKGEARRDRKDEQVISDMKKQLQEAEGDEEDKTNKGSNANNIDDPESAADKKKAETVLKQEVEVVDASPDAAKDVKNEKSAEGGAGQTAAAIGEGKMH